MECDLHRDSQLSYSAIDDVPPGDRLRSRAAHDSAATRMAIDSVTDRCSERRPKRITVDPYKADWDAPHQRNGSAQCQVRGRFDAVPGA
jgi:hypothetical protein